MGKRGPAAKPTALKVLEGTYREDRHGGGMRAPNGLPLKPAWLGEIASKVWDECIGELELIPGLLSPVDGPALATYCHAWQRFHDSQREIDINGSITCVSEKGGEYMHPAVAIQHKAIELIAKIGAKFGMTPSDRAGLKPTGRTELDDLADLIA
jgi:P27 family predicted phage terminase small subunit